MSGTEIKDRKLAIIMITTHGNLDPLEEKIRYDLSKHPTVRKINATADAVCNWTSPDGLNEMIGQRMNGYIRDMKQRETKKCKKTKIEYNPDNIICLYGTDKEQQLQIQHFSKSLRTFMPTIDNIRQDAKQFVDKTAKGKPATFDIFDEESSSDPDMHSYMKSLPKSYQLEKWEEGKEYYNKIYTIIRSELVGEDVSAIDNTMFFLGEKHLKKLPLPELPVIPQTRSSIKKDDITFKLSEILEKLKELGYTDTIIIDLSCNAGYDGRSARRLVRAEQAKAKAKAKEKAKAKAKEKAGGKRTKIKRKKPSKKKRKSKRTRKHRKK